MGFVAVSAVEVAVQPQFDVYRYVEVVHERSVAILDTFHHPIDLQERLFFQLLPVNLCRERKACPEKYNT